MILTRTAITITILTFVIVSILAIIRLIVSVMVAVFAFMCSAQGWEFGVQAPSAKQQFTSTPLKNYHLLGLSREHGKISLRGHIGIIFRYFVLTNKIRLLFRRTAKLLL